MGDTDHVRIRAACRRGEAGELLSLATEAALRLDIPQVYSAMTTLPQAASVEMSRERETAWIARVGTKYRLRFNPDFFMRYHRTGEDVLHTLLHELSHRLRGDLHGRSAYYDWVDNVAADLLVNRGLWTELFHGGPAYFSALYPRDRFPACLFLPPDLLGIQGEADIEEAAFCVFRRAKGINSREAGTAALIYKWLWQGDVTFRWLTDALATILDAGGEDPVLIGGYEEGDAAEGWNWLRSALWWWPGAMAGHSDRIEEERTEVTPVSASTLADAIRHALVYDGRHPRHMLRLAPDRGLVPFPGRREALLLAAGIDPIFYPCPLPSIVDEERRVHLYIDVSGSTREQWATLYGMILRLRDELSEPFYLFSNEVEEVSQEDIKSGIVRTTYGTDFDCVAEHALRRRFRRILVITDGDASLDEALAARLRRERVETFEVLTDSTCSSGLAAIARRSWTLVGVEGKR